MARCVVFLRRCATLLLLVGTGMVTTMSLSLPFNTAQAWYVSVDGTVAPLAEPIAGRVKIAAGIAKGHWQTGGSVSFIPVPAFTLYKDNSGGVDETIEGYPVFFGAEVNYYIFSRSPYAKRNDWYVGSGVDFPVIAESFLPGIKIGTGYAFRLHRKVAVELGVDYYFFGALTNEVFVGLGFKGIF